MQRVVIDPPVQDGKFLYQEECCYNLCEQWQVPARALHIATDLDAPYIPPLANWDEFAAAVRQYDEAWMMFTHPLSQYLEVPENVRDRITAVTNPHTCDANIDDWGFKATTTTVEFGLDVDERLWFLFDDNPATIQVNSGCPYGCHYCPWNRGVFPRQRWADPWVTAELTSRAENPYLLCSQITGDHEWVEAFVNALQLPFPRFSTDLNCADLPAYGAYGGDIQRLAEVGMMRAIVGVEALSEQSLRRLGCSHNVIQIRAMFALLAELAVHGVYQLRRGYGETLEEIGETTEALLAIASDLKSHLAPHTIRVGRIYYWHASELSRSLKTKLVAPLGFPVQVEDLDPDRLDAWNSAYQSLRAAGWNVR